MESTKNINPNVRKRLLYALQNVDSRNLNMLHYTPEWLYRIIATIVPKLYEESEFVIGTYLPYIDNYQLALYHFFHCSDSQVCEFLEMVFFKSDFAIGNEGVQRINDILKEEGIPYEFTPYIADRLPFAAHECPNAIRIDNY